MNNNIKVKILILNSDILLFNLYATALTKRLKKIYGEQTHISWVSTENINSSLKYNSSINVLYDIKDEKFKNEYFDIVINFNIDDDNLFKEIDTKKRIGIHQEGKSDIFRDILVGKKKTRSNLFQIFFKLANTTWKGEGIDLGYYPKTKQKKDNIGYLIANDKVETAVINKIKNNNHVNKIRKCKNFFKQIDHINKYEYIITDDLLISLLAGYLKKYVYFVNTYSVNHKIELFNKGKFFKIPRKFFYEN